MIVAFDASTNISLSTLSICFEGNVPKEMKYWQFISLLKIPDDKFIVSASSSNIPFILHTAKCNLLQLGCPSLNLVNMNLNLNKIEFLKDYDQDEYFSDNCDEISV